MAGLAENVAASLEPFVGPMVAGTCLGATAISLGKTRDELDASDMSVIEANIRRLLAPVAPAAAIDAIVEGLRVGVT